MSSRITIKEIAKKANISIGTVDRVLHNRGRVAERTRLKVLEIAKSGNYASNVYARHLRLNKTYNIAVVLPPANFYWRKLKEGIMQGIEAYASLGFVVTEYVLGGSDKLTLNEIIKLVLDAKPDGIILSPGFFSQDSKELNMLKTCKIPYVFVDSNIEKGGSLTFIGQDSFKSGQVAAGLLDKGFCDPYELFIITFSENELAQKTTFARIKGLKHYYSHNIQNIQHTVINIHEINIERDGLTIQQLMDMFLALKKPVHLFVPNSKSYILGKALLPLNEQLKLRFVGFDLIDSNIELLNNNTIDYLIYQKPQMQGFLAVQALYQYLVLAKKVPINQYMPFDIITKENLKYANG